MRLITTLMDEHRVIEQVLNCLEAMVDQASAARKLDGQSARTAVDFFRNFADRCHHGKEEDLLFTMLEERGFAREGGPTGVMLHEHEQGRARVSAMADAIDGAAAGDPDGLQQFTLHAKKFVLLLREHIQKEDHCLFPMADSNLTEQDKEALTASFEKLEEETEEWEIHARYRKVADGLAQRFAIGTIPS